MSTEITVQELSAIEPSKADKIRATFLPMTDMLQQFEAAYNAVVSEAETSITTETTAKAKRLRLDIAKIRIETDKIRKAEKEEYLRAGKAIDAVSNVLKWAVVEKEEKLKQIEDHFAIMERERLERLQAARVEALSPYVDDAEERDLSSMDDDVWEAYWTAKRKAYEDRIAAEKQAELDRMAAEKKAEAERVERQRKEAEERKRIEAENERLRKEAEARRIAEEKRRKQEAAERAEMLEKQRIEREKIEAKAKAEREAAEEKARITREQHEAQLMAERAERERIQREIDAQKEAQRIAEAEKARRLQAELQKGDSEKMVDMLAAFDAIERKYSNAFSADKNVVLMGRIVNAISKIRELIELNQRAYNAS